MSAQAAEVTDVAVTATGEYECKIYYQDTTGVIRESIHLVSGWKHTTTPTFSAKLASPLAAISFDSGKEVRVYCVSPANLLEEHCYTAKHSNNWVPGGLNNAKIHVSPSSKIAATYWASENNIRVYVQEPNGQIQEYGYNNSRGWQKMNTFPVAEDGSSLSALYWESKGQVCLRLYYLAGSTVKEFCYEGGRWFGGEFTIPQIPPYFSIASSAWVDSRAGVHIRVWLQDSSNKIVAYRNDGGWNNDDAVLGPLRPGRRIAALEWKTGTELRIFYHADDGKIREKAQTDAGAWYEGEYVS